MHLIHQPLAFLSFTRWDVVITFVYLLFPLSFFSTYIAIERINPTLWEAAADLGAKPWRSTMRVTIPLIRSGLLAAFAFCFISMLGDYATPTLIGGTDGTLFSNIIVNQFGSSVEWGFGAALAVIMLLAVLVMLVALRVASGSAAAIGEYTMKYQHRRSRAGLAYSVLFVVFLYVPIALLVLLAFNDSSTAGLPIQGFTLNWFTTVFHDSILLSALRTSLRVAAISVGCGLLLGSIAAVQLARGRGALRNLSIGIVSLPLLLPPVVLGLAIIIATQWLGLQRGMWTIIVGHILITLPVIVLLLIVRLEGLDPNVELAAMDLGARPWQTFLRISVPQALPAIIAAGMIAFALSMDEFIMTFLITGSQTTLPLYIWGSIRFVITPELNALSTLMLGMSFVLLLGGALIGFGRGRVIRRAA
jgi:ABC-type spermidine/putrescine transport system permease subunit II